MASLGLAHVPHRYHAWTLLPASRVRERRQIGFGSFLPCGDHEAGKMEGAGTTTLSSIQEFVRRWWE
jgi:hypothetical protein